MAVHKSNYSLLYYKCLMNYFKQLLDLIIMLFVKHQIITSFFFLKKLGYIDNSSNKEGKVTMPCLVLLPIIWL